MGRWHRTALVSLALIGLATSARAEPGAEDPDPLAPTAGTAEEEAPEEAGEKKPGRGDFDAGGQVRLPNGPDEMGEFATFNWIALDLQGRYFLLDSVTVNGHIPLAVKKPDTIMGGAVDPSLIGGIDVRLEAMLPRLPFQAQAGKTKVGVVLSGAYMREGAMLLSPRDFPLFAGDFQPGFTAGAIANVELSSLFSFSTEPLLVYQSGTAESLTAVQIPTSTIVRLGSLVKLSADLGVFTGDDYSFGGDDGGRISAGGSLTVKLGPILAHAGAGVASLLTGALYPTIGDSLYIDLNVKYAK